MKVEKELAPKLKKSVKKNEPMACHTSWQVGGPADYYLCPVDLKELAEIVKFSNKYEQPLYVIGSGTNLLVLDGGIRGLVVKMGEPFSFVQTSGNRLIAGAGTPVSYLARTASEQGLAGLEFAVGIPGSLGGAVVMNAGAFGGYIGEKIRSVKLVSSRGEIKTLERDELSFGYRTSNLPREGIIAEVELELTSGDPEESNRLIERFLAERSLRHPKLPSAGSVFRNLPGRPAGRLIDEAGGKGMRVGGAEVSQRHANFIVNTGRAKASDILALIEEVRGLVKDKFGVELQPEVKIIGEEN